MDCKLFFLFVCALLFGSCRNDNSVKNKESKPHTKQTIDVKVASVEHSKLYKTIQMRGVVDAEKHQKLYFKRSGYLLSLKAKMGQHVSKGTLLALLDTQEVARNLNRKRLSLAEAEQKWKCLRIDQGLSLEALKQQPTVARSLDLRSHLSLSRLDLSTAKQQYNESFVRASFSGLVANIDYKKGDFVTSGKYFGELYDPNSLYIDSHLLEEDLSKVHIGDLSEVTLSNEAIKLKAHISIIDPLVKEDGLVTIRLKLDDPSKNLYRGMHVKVAYRAMASEPHCLVPLKAIVKRTGKNIVFVVQDGKAKWKEVTLGDRSDTMVEVLEGVRPNDKVVVENNLLLTHDVEVHIIKNNKL